MSEAATDHEPHSMTRARLAELGFDLPPAPKPIANFEPATRVDNIVYTSGQIPLQEGQLVRTGKLGADIDVVEGKRLTAICAVNALAAAATVCDLDHVRVIKATGFIASAEGFDGQPAVMNGASDLLVEVFNKKGNHARSAVGVAELPLSAPVEVELVLAVL